MTKHSYDKPISHEQKTRTASGLSSLLWMFVGALIAVMIGVFLYLSPLFDSFKTDVEVNPPVQVEPLPQKEQADNYDFYEVLPKREFETGTNANSAEKDPEAQTTAKATPDAVVIAKKAEVSDVVDETSTADTADVVIEEEDVTYEDEPVPQGSIQISASQNSYILQIRSYDNPEDADRMRAEVMMAGVDARIVQRTDGEVTLYQVISNTMNSREEALLTSKRLSRSGIDSLVVEQRRQ